MCLSLLLSLSFLSQMDDNQHLEAETITPIAQRKSTQTERERHIRLWSSHSLPIIPCLSLSLSLPQECVCVRMCVCECVFDQLQPQLPNNDSITNLVFFKWCFEGLDSFWANQTLSCRSESRPFLSQAGGGLSSPCLKSSTENNRAKKDLTSESDTRFISCSSLRETWMWLACFASPSSSRRSEDETPVSVGNALGLLSCFDSGERADVFV